MKKIIRVILVAVVAITAVSCDAISTGCWRIEGTMPNGVKGVWYDANSKMGVKVDCQEAGITDYSITKSKDYTLSSCPDDFSQAVSQNKK